MSGDITIATFERGPTERLAILWREYEGHHFADLRVQFLGADGTWRPTKKGVTIKIKEVFGASDALAKVCELAGTVRR